MRKSDKLWVFVLCILLAGSVIGLLSVDRNVPKETPAEPVWIEEPGIPLPAIPAFIDSPASEPADMPSTTTSTAPAEVPPFTPLRDARVGEFARYAALDDMQIHYRVVGLDSLGATIETRVFQSGKPLGLPAQRLEKRDVDPLRREARRVQATRRMSSVTIDVAGRSWKAMLYEDRWVDEEIPYLRRTWVSMDAPVMGILRMELEGDGQLEARLELIERGVDTGRKEP